MVCPQRPTSDAGVADRWLDEVPIVPEDPPDYEQDGLLTSVIARGPIYRPTPSS
jgi:hypothetical protein